MIRGVGIGILIWLAGLILGLGILSATAKIAGDAFVWEIPFITVNPVASLATFVLWWYLAGRLARYYWTQTNADAVDVTNLAAIFAASNFMLDFVLYVKVLGPGFDRYFTNIGPWAGYVILFLAVNKVGHCRDRH